MAALGAQEVRRLDPWPVVADLFSGLLVACFAALIAFSVFATKKLKEQETRIQIDKLQDHVRQILEKTLQPPITVSRCDVEDLCVSVQIQFRTDRDELDAGFQGSLDHACRDLQRSFAGWQAADREKLFIQIEGHSDSQQPKIAANPRALYLHNWKLSSERASSVLYEFDRCGLSQQGIKMVAVGLADTQPLCQEKTEECFKKNRRTTFRIKPDREAIQRNAKKIVGGSSPR